MAVHVLTSCAVYHGALDLTGQANSVEATIDINELDGTTFGDGGFSHPVPGLKSGTFNYAGFLDPTDGSDALLLADTSSTNVPVTIGFDATIGALAWHGQGMNSTFAPLSGSVGELAQLNGSIKTSLGYGLRSGKLLAIKAARGSTVSTTGVQLFTSGTITLLTAAIHVFSGSGSTVVTVASSATQGGSYTTRGTFTAATAAGKEYISVTGLSVTDQWWRTTFTVGSGTTTAAVSAAVS